MNSDLPAPSSQADGHVNTDIPAHEDNVRIVPAASPEKLLQAEIDAVLSFIEKNDKIDQGQANDAKEEILKIIKGIHATQQIRIQRCHDMIETYSKGWDDSVKAMVYEKAKKYLQPHDRVMFFASDITFMWQPVEPTDEQSVSAQPGSTPSPMPSSLHDHTQWMHMAQPNTSRFNLPSINSTASDLRTSPPTNPFSQHTADRPRLDQSWSKAEMTPDRPKRRYDRLDNDGESGAVESNKKAKLLTPPEHAKVPDVTPIPPKNLQSKSHHSLTDREEKTDGEESEYKDEDDGEDVDEIIPNITIPARSTIISKSVITAQEVQRTEKVFFYPADFNPLPYVLRCPSCSWTFSDNPFKDNLAYNHFARHKIVYESHRRQSNFIMNFGRLVYDPETMASVDKNWVANHNKVITDAKRRAKRNLIQKQKRDGGDEIVDADSEQDAEDDGDDPTYRPHHRAVGSDDE